MRALLLGCLLALGCSSRQEPVSAPRPTSWQPEILSPASSVALPDFSYAGYRWGEAAPLPSPWSTSPLCSMNKMSDSS